MGNNDNTRRAVITGIGVATPLGSNWSDFKANVLAGHSAVQRFTEDFEDIHQLDVPLCRVADFDESRDLPNSKSRSLDRFSNLALFSARQAIAQAGVDGSLLDQICLGSCAGGLETIETGILSLAGGNLRLSPMTIPKFMSNAPASAISIDFQSNAPSFCVSSACSSSSQAIILAVRSILSGQNDIVLTGGTESSLTFGHIAAWKNLGVMTNDTCRPFSANRSGLVLGEGAAMFVIESLDSAQKRGATILAEFLGCAESSDAKSLTTPDVDVITKTLGAALRDAGLSPESVDYINAHGTATKLNDKIEAAAIKRVFGEAPRRPLVSSTKAMHGHLLGGAGAIEMAASLAAIETGQPIRNVNHEEFDPDIDIALSLDGTSDKRVDTVLSSSFAFGGHNAIIVLQRFEPE